MRSDFVRTLDRVGVMEDGDEEVDVRLGDLTSDSDD